MSVNELANMEEWILPERRRSETQERLAIERRRCMDMLKADLAVAAERVRRA